MWPLGTVSGGPQPGQCGTLRGHALRVDGITVSYKGKKPWCLPLLSLFPYMAV
jgi:hypothetical protein